MNCKKHEPMMVNPDDFKDVSKYDFMIMKNKIVNIRVRLCKKCFSLYWEETHE